MGLNAQAEFIKLTKSAKFFSTYASEEAHRGKGDGGGEDSAADQGINCPRTVANAGRPCKSEVTPEAAASSYLREPVCILYHAYYVLRIRNFILLRNFIH